MNINKQNPFYEDLQISDDLFDLLFSFMENTWKDKFDRLSELQLSQNFISELLIECLEALKTHTCFVNSHHLRSDDVNSFLGQRILEIYNYNNTIFPILSNPNKSIQGSLDLSKFDLPLLSSYKKDPLFSHSFYNANPPHIERSIVWNHTNNTLLESSSTIKEGEIENSISKYKSASEILKRRKTQMDSVNEQTNCVIEKLEDTKFDDIRKTKNNTNDNNDIYREILGGEAKQEILEWVLGMRLSMPDKQIHESDISGLSSVKKLLRDKIINPILRPELHVGLHQAPRGILLFGPPGTGKTMLAKWMASSSGATFFEVTPSSLISKYHGETETLISTLFKVAEIHSPSIIFIDEIDSLLGKRRENEDDSTIRMKNQLLQMIDGVSSRSTKLVVLVGATNRPDMLDEAALRRLSKRVYIPLPDSETRIHQIRRLLENNAIGGCTLNNHELRAISLQLEGWNGSDLKSLCSKAAEYSYDEAIELFEGIQNIPNRNVFRNITYDDFQAALKEVHPSSNNSSCELEAWHKSYGNV